MTTPDTDYMLDMKVSPEEAVELEKQGFRPVAKLPPSEMSEQLKKELLRVINEGPFTIAVATHVEKFVVAAREILMTEKLAKNDIAALIRRKKRHMGGIYQGAMIGGDYDGDYSDDMAGNLTVGPIPNENFGVQAIKQMIEALRSMNDSPTKLVDALAAARQHGLHDVAAQLEKKLGVEKEARPPADLDAPPPAAKGATS